MSPATGLLRAIPILLAGIVIQSICLADGPTFDAASVRLLDPNLPKTLLFSGGPATTDPGRLRLHVNMAYLLGAAFGANVDQIKGPAWLRDFSAMPFYDIAATMPADTTKEQLQKMLQNLLVDRFGLVFHHETGNFPSYELVVDKGGPKLKEIASGPNTAGSATTGSDGFPTVSGPWTSGWRAGTLHQRIKDQEWSMRDLARSLGSLVGRSQGKSVDDGFLLPRVTDKTGLTGKYTFILEYDCAACVPLAAASATANDPGVYPDIFIALQNELGLRLVKAPDIAMDVIVVEAVDKTPTKN